MSESTRRLFLLYYSWPLLTSTTNKVLSSMYDSFSQYGDLNLAVPSFARMSLSCIVVLNIMCIQSMEMHDYMSISIRVYLILVN